MHDQELWDGQAGSFGLYPGDQPVIIRVRFGDKPDQTIPLEWAEDILTRWHKRNPAAFGTQLAETVKAWAVAQYATQDDNTSD